VSGSQAIQATMIHAQACKPNSFICLYSPVASTLLVESMSTNLWNFDHTTGQASNVSATMDRPTANEMQKTLRPITSLLSKSEKACQKLAPGSWQHTMLTNNIRALHIASLLMSNDGERKETVASNQLADAARALSDMASRTEKSRSKFLPGTSQHTLQCNRLNALRVAEDLVKQEMEHSNTDKIINNVRSAPDAEKLRRL
jgi:hypothetical protein